MQAALLPDRGVVKVAGDDARQFLNGLVTTDIGKVTPASAALCGAAYAAGQDHRRFHRRGGAGRRTAAAFSSTARARCPGRWWTLNFYKLRAKVIERGPVGGAGRDGGLGRRGAKANTACAIADPRLPALGARSCCRRTSRQRRPPISARSLSTPEDLRSAPHRARRAARRARFHLWRCLPARSRHGSVRRRRFRQGLLRRPGGRVARGASRHRAQPRRAGCLRGRCTGWPGCR